MVFDRYDNIWFAQHTVDNIAAYDPHNNNLIEVPVPTETSFVQFMTSDGYQLKYTELASPLIAMGIIATSLFFVRSVKDKRRLNSLINS